MASPECIVETFAFIGGTYGSKFPTPTETDMAVWSKLLTDIDDAALFDAVAAHCSSETWPPTPAELITRAGHRRSFTAPYHRPFSSGAAGLGDGPAPMAELTAELTPRARQSIDEARRALQREAASDG